MVTENVLLQKIRLPGKRFRLPSRGLFYKDGEIKDTVVDGEVEVFSMTTIDEIALRSPEFLYSGEAIDRVFKRCVPEILKPLRLLTKDVDFILACLRIVSYGGIYQIYARCPKCEEKQGIINNEKRTVFFKEVEEKAAIQEIDLDVALEDPVVVKRLEAIMSKNSDEYIYNVDLAGIIRNNTTEISDEDLKDYHVVLTNGQQLEMTPIKMDSAVATFQFQNNTQTMNLTVVDEFISFMIASAILSIDGITNHDMICEWAKELPIEFKHELETKLQFKEWGTSFDYMVKCQNETCEHERNINTLLNPITFFMMPSKLEGLNS
jgi:hypothetical protein